MLYTCLGTLLLHSVNHLPMGTLTNSPKSLLISSHLQQHQILTALNLRSLILSQEDPQKRNHQRLAESRFWFSSILSFSDASVSFVGPSKTEMGFLSFGSP